MNFVVVILGDNDFGMPLYNALRDLVDYSGGIDFCPTLAKRYIIEHMISASACKNIIHGADECEIEQEREHLRKYLSTLTVTFDQTLPTYDPEGTEIIDHEVGSVYYDVNLDKVFYLQGKLNTT